jgi:hypothetical protein
VRGPWPAWRCRRRLCRQAGRAPRADAGADPHRRALCALAHPPMARRCRGLRGPDRAPARQCRPALGSRAERGGAPVVTGYDLSLLNVESRFEIPASSRRCSAAATAPCVSTVRRAPARRRWPSTSPALQRPLMIRQASDLVSKYVGETEQNMARMFEEAQRAGGAAARRGRQLPAQPPLAERNYEVTEVNEMLQGMERFRACSSAPPTCSTGSTRRRCAASPSRSASCRSPRAQRERMFVAEALGGDDAP